MYKDSMLLFLLGVVFSYISSYDSFFIVNRTLDSKALTLFNYETGDSNLPLRLVSITTKNIRYQTFNLLYNNEYYIWFSPEIDNSYISVGGSIYITAQKGDVDPNLRLEYILNKKREKVFRIIKVKESRNSPIGDKKKECLTVDDIKEGGTYEEYWPLIFQPCERDNIKQDFIFIPSIIGRSYVDDRNKFQISEYQKANERLNRIMRIVKEYKDEKKEDNNPSKATSF